MYIFNAMTKTKNKKQTTDRFEEAADGRKAPEPLARILVRLPAQHKRELETIAREEGESLNTVIRVAIRRFLRMA